MMLNDLTTVGLTHYLTSHSYLLSSSVSLCRIE